MEMVAHLNNWIATKYLEYFVFYIRKNKYICNGNSGVLR